MSKINIRTKRWMIQSIWHGWNKTDTWKEKLGDLFYRPSFGSDEVDNHSIYMTIFGIWIVFFYGRVVLDVETHWYLSGAGPDGEHWYNVNEPDHYVTMPSSVHSLRYMMHYEDTVGIKESHPSLCPPTPIPLDLMDHLINTGAAELKVD